MSHAVPLILTLQVSIIKSKFFWFIEAVAQTCPAKKMFLEISQNPQENICVRVSILIILQASDLGLIEYPKTTCH